MLPGGARDRCADWPGQKPHKRYQKIEEVNGTTVARLEPRLPPAVSACQARAAHQAALGAALARPPWLIEATEDHHTQQRTQPSATQAAQAQPNSTRWRRAPQQSCSWPRCFWLAFAAPTDCQPATSFLLPASNCQQARSPRASQIWSQRQHRHPAASSTASMVTGSMANTASSMANMAFTANMACSFVQLDQPGD